MVVSGAIVSFVITVAQQKGGAGKTSLSAHLAAYWSNPPASERVNEPLRVTVLDADPQGSLGHWFELREANGNEQGGLTVKKADGWRLSSEVSRARRQSDIVIVDMPPRADNSTTTAFRAADLVLVPMQLTPMDLWATGPTIELAEHFNVPALVVLNRVPPRTRLNDTIAEAVRGKGWPLATTMLGNRVAFAASLLDGRGVTEAAASSLGAGEMRLLAGEVLQATRRIANAA